MRFLKMLEKLKKIKLKNRPSRYVKHSTSTFKKIKNSIILMIFKNQNVSYITLI